MSRDPKLHAVLVAVPAGFAFVFGTNWHAFNGAAQYAAMARIMSEPSWAGFMATLSTIGVVGLLTGRRHVRLASVAILCGTHLMLTGLWAMSLQVSTGTVIYAILSVAAIALLRDEYRHHALH